MGLSAVPLWAVVLVSATEGHFLQDLHLGANHVLAGTFPTFAHRVFVLVCLC